MQLTTYYVMQDGRDFYCFTQPDMSGMPAKICSYPHKVTDWNLEEAQKARRWFQAMCATTGIDPKFPNPFN